MLLDSALNNGCRGAGDLVCSTHCGRCFPFPTSHMVLSLRHFVVYILTEELSFNSSSEGLSTDLYFEIDSSVSWQRTIWSTKAYFCKALKIIGHFSIVQI